MEFQEYNVKAKMKRKKESEIKVTKVIKKYIYRYKIDNKYQKAKLKNLGQSLEFQKYNVKEKKKKKKTRSQSYKIYIYEVCFFFKKRVFFFCKVIIGYKSEN